MAKQKGVVETGRQKMAREVADGQACGEESPVFRQGLFQNNYALDFLGWDPPPLLN